MPCTNTSPDEMRPIDVTDPRTIRIITVALAAITMIGTIGIIGLAAWQREIPDPLQNITSAALGALAAMLVSTRSIVTTGE